jgi:predicted porin
MKKSLIAMAVLAAAGAASAQSSVTLFGIVDAAVQRGTGVTSKNQLGNSGYNSSRLGFRGVEDLGGGMSASFWLEAGLQNDNGAGLATNTNNQATGGAVAGIGGGQGLTFNRRSTVSLSGGWGEVRLGRDYTPQFWNLTVFDPYGTNGAGTTQTLSSIITGVTSVRASNSVGYFLPSNLGGIYGQVQYYYGENNSGTATEDDGTGYGLRVGYAAGPINVAVAVSRTEYAAGDVRQNNIGGAYDFGVGKLMAHYSRDRNGAVRGKGWLVGGLVPVGAGEIRLAYSQYETNLVSAAVNNPETRKLALGYVHNLSKRTAVYATVARVRNEGFGALTASQALNGATNVGNRSSNGYDLGVRHSF